MAAKKQLGAENPVIQYFTQTNIDDIEIFEETWTMLGPKLWCQKCMHNIQQENECKKIHI